MAVCFSCSFTFRLADAPLSPELAGGQDTVSTRNVAQDCLLLCCVVFVLHFQLGTSSPRGAVGRVTFRFVRLLFSHLRPPTH